MEAFFTEAVSVWLRELQPTLERYLVFTVGVWLALWVVLRPLLAARKIRDESPPARQLLTEAFFSVRSMVIFATAGVATYYLYRAGLYPLTPLAASWGAPWLAVSIVMGVIGLDAWFYWTHRLMHDPRLFRRFHRRHHRSNNPSPFTAYSFDIGEALTLFGFVMVWPAIFPMHPSAMQWVMLYQIVTNTLLHSGYELMPARRDGRPMLDFIVTTTHHDMHHAQAGWNYAAWFTWWDRALGTEHPEYHARYAEKAWRPFGGRVLQPAE
ncbi:sterol desaturase family protein [Phenylobacterium sp. J426]|uniref:sterol desaturase family protein n=1 Tax=Phenylobacterium sp. J426 TaxID=2898439 RepID=UPI002151E4D5|nr:sterol desaturase family protein [Phenylobacterium sp. J426]MCR5875350.1 sterol desaturase family protein [Phenylobacterium sp. J426]